MSRLARYRASILLADERRARFLQSAQAAKQRIAPARLRSDVKDGVGHAVNDAGARLAAKVRERPVATGAAGAALAAWLARRPLAALFRRLYVRLSNRNPETDDG
jgi:hypothetical protein